jgi:hypothetical protein
MIRIERKEDMAKHRGALVGLVIVVLLLIIFFLVPVVPFSVTGSPVLGLASVTLSGTYSPSCLAFGFGVLRITNAVINIPATGVSVGTALYAGWSNYCSNSQIANGNYKQS